MTNKTEIGHCRDCKWWDSEPIPAHYDAVNDKEQGTEVLRMCGRPESDDYSNGIYFDYDTISTHEAFMPGPDFGCVHWEEKK